ncbi:hypothetical protein PORY_000621 [Pneumocystis oryctolagi]|uniref:Uncharacterized protein n=1 Tax=Pneumocystis oryctolagi TaxID=42067 RepID=A0ACB7CDS3_9ASCO|nr:hypothetical protein PORY_000621 [Pneumocystis oryctolagi]
MRKNLLQHIYKHFPYRKFSISTKKMTIFQQKNSDHVSNSAEINQTSMLSSDPVYFVRDASNFTKTTHERAASVKLKLEHLYKVAVEQTVERNQRHSRMDFEAKLAQDRYTYKRFDMMTRKGAL